MKVTLIHNPSAGNGHRSRSDELIALVRSAGHLVKEQSAKEKDWQAVLQEPADLVAVAGGDGTVAKVARLLVEQSTPLAVLPQGTANNIAHTLGVTDIPLRELIAGWKSARPCRFDVGVAGSPMQQDDFLEALGMGFFAWTTSQLDNSGNAKGSAAKDPQEELRLVRRHLRERLEQFTARQLDIQLDGQDLSGEYLLVATMNIQSIGPNLVLAPQADPSDGLFDLVLIGKEEKDKLAEHLRDEPEGSRYPGLTIQRGKHLHVEAKETELHLDDRSWPDAEKIPKGRQFSVDVRVKRHALTLLVPASG
ncbi:MAG TPA: diacylglycerol kinase family protein [Gemmataceae bacterium]|nr:diacylglycerol kinase family protein [Gemmataceae bacterium]